MKQRINPKDRAKELTNKIYQPLGYLNCHVSSGEMWEYARSRAKEQVDLIKDELPMYTGNLNPDWHYWNEVRIELDRMP